MSQLRLEEAIVDLANTIRCARKKEGIDLTQMKLAQLLGCTISTIGHLEQRKPDYNKALPGYRLTARMELVLQLEPGTLWKKVEVVRSEQQMMRAISQFAAHYGDCYEGGRDLSTVLHADPATIGVVSQILPDVIRILSNSDHREELGILIRQMAFPFLK